MSRSEDRSSNTARGVDIEIGFHRNAEGSVLYRAGGTVVLCTASIEDSVPKWFSDDQGGWLTAEYQMHPRANPQSREQREGRGRGPKGRTMEIQRLIGRGLRAAFNLKRLGQRTITVDCDVLEADGGTRTASVTAGFMATAVALFNQGLAGVLRDQVAAISVGLVNGNVLVDLDYAEDSSARVDLNVIATVDGGIIEVQGTAEGQPIRRERFDAMLDAATEAIGVLGKRQREALEKADVDLQILKGSS